ncbi:hypothetical protein [Dysgonomonas reticulitermitis]
MWFFLPDCFARADVPSVCCAAKRTIALRTRHGQNVRASKEDTLVQAIQSIRIEPRVAVSDIYRVQDSMVSIDSWAGV